VKPGTLLFFEVQNRNPKAHAHATVYMNGDVQGIWRLRPNEKVNIRHPALGDPASDKGKFEVQKEEAAIERDLAAGKAVNHTTRESRESLHGVGGTVTIRFEAENNTANTRNVTRNKRYEEDGEEFTTTKGKIKVAAVVSKSHRLAVKPPEGKSMGVIDDEALQAMMKASAKKCGEPARITQSEAKFSTMLYQKEPSPLDLDNRNSYSDTFSFQVTSEDAPEEPPSKRAKTE